MKTFFEIMKQDWKKNKVHFTFEVYALFVFIFACGATVFFLFQPDIISKLFGVFGLFSCIVLSLVLFSDW